MSAPKSQVIKIPETLQRHILPLAATSTGEGAEEGSGIEQRLLFNHGGRVVGGPRTATLPGLSSRTVPLSALRNVGMPAKEGNSPRVCT